MSLYNMLHGVKPAAFFLLPMVERMHPDDWPRFRDCFTSDPERPQKEQRIIIVYTRMGGGNAECWGNEGSDTDVCLCAACRLQGILDDLRSKDLLVDHYDDDFDCTYTNIVCKIPEEWHEEYDAITSGKFDPAKARDEYKKLLLSTFPKLEEKLSALFNKKGGDDG